MYYPIKNKIKDRIENREKYVAEADDLPYDFIAVDTYGKLAKHVWLNKENNRYISVMELLCLDKSIIDISKDEELQLVWENYMEQVTIEDIRMSDILELVSKYKDEVTNMKEKLDALPVH
jgi:hypothetical protein